MSEIKINLSLTLQGSILLSEQECSRKLKNKQECYDHFSLSVEDQKTKKKEVLHIATRKTRTIKQNIKLSKEAYEYMIGEESYPNYPNPKSKKAWEKLSKEQRLKYHCGKIAEQLGAIDFSFEVFDD